MYRINEWNENETFSSKKIVQDVSATSAPIKTSCCIDTTSITSDPWSRNIQTSCCIDTIKE